MDMEPNGLSPNFHIRVCERFYIYFHDQSAYSATGKYVCGPIRGIYKSLTDT
jgi:hypothetical protein